MMGQLPRLFPFVLRFISLAFSYAIALWRIDSVSESGSDSETYPSFFPVLLQIQIKYFNNYQYS